MLLRWLLTVFPHDMRLGWRLIASDLAFWVALAAGLVLLAYVEAEVQDAAGLGGSDSADFAAVAAGLLRRLVWPLVFVAAALRFRSFFERRPLPWSRTAATAARRLVPAALAWLAAAGVSLAGAWLAQVAALSMLRWANGGPESLRVASVLVGTAAYVVLLVRFAFVPYLAALRSGSELAARAERPPRSSLLYKAFWPLIESSRMTAGLRWRVLPYLLLVIYAPLAAVATPSMVRPFASLALHLLAFTALAALFRYYAERARELWPESPIAAAARPA